MRTRMLLLGLLGAIAAGTLSGSVGATVVGWEKAIKVQGDLPLETLAPLGCGLLTGAGAVRNRLKPRAGASFAVFGVGALGIAALHMAKKAGCSPIIAVDLHASRLATAQEFGATHVIDASSAADTVAELLTICPVGVDYAYEATGSVAVMEQVITGLATGGSRSSRPPCARRQGRSR